MKDTHIIDVIDNVSLASLSTIELDEIRVHARECDSCGAAFKAAQISALVIKERAHVKLEPSPFFHTKVLAAVREQRALDDVPAFVRLWNSARAVVSGMAVATLALAALTFVVPDPVTALQEQTASVDAAESVIFDQGDEQLSYEQVLAAIYEEEVEAR